MILQVYIHTCTQYILPGSTCHVCGTSTAVPVRTAVSTSTGSTQRTHSTVPHERIHDMYRALSDLRAVKKQHFGIHHPPAEILSLNSSIA